MTGTEPAPPGWEAAASLQAAQEGQAVSDSATDNGLACQLGLAAEQFRVARRTPGESPRSPQRTVIARYHWFTEWGRDTMISLPGLAMRPGMLWEARAVLDTNIRYLDRGLIPNRFPDTGQPPEYDTMDATLWMFQALATYLRISGDWRFVADRLDAWREHFRPKLWWESFEDVGIDVAFYSHRSRPIDEVLPWDHILVKKGREYLAKEQTRSVVQLEAMAGAV